MNLHSEDETLTLIFGAAYAAVQTGFRYLALQHIITPPHPWFDAALARQIAIRIVGVDFDVPRRRMAAHLGCNRERVSCSIVAINRRLIDPVFEAEYLRMKNLALDLYAHELKKAVA